MVLLFSQATNPHGFLALTKLGSKNLKPTHIQAKSIFIRLATHKLMQTRLNMAHKQNKNAKAFWILKKANYCGYINMRGVVGILQMLLQDLSMAFKLQVTSLVIIFCKPLESKRSKTGVCWTF